MAEIPDVVGGETITDEWGNQIRSRTVQRYATVAARTAAHPSPTEGDLSYLQDSNTVDVFDGTAWKPVGASSEVDGSVEVVGPVAFAGGGTDVATVNLTIPTGWGSWKCEAYATFNLVSTSGTISVTNRIRIDGADQAANVTPTPTSTVFGSVGGRLTGLVTTGSRPVSLRCVGGSGNGRTSNIYLYARAVRTS